MKNYIRENLAMLSVFAMIAFIVVIAFKGCQTLNESNEAYKRDQLNKTNWFQKHNCKPIGYVGAGTSAPRLYLCDDNIQYIWRDIPTSE